MYRKFNITIQFRDKVYGGLPKSKKMVESYVKAKFNSDDTTLTATDLDLTEETEKITTGFRKDDRGVYLGTYQLKAALKQYSSLNKVYTSKRGTKQTVKETLFIKGRIADELTDEKCYVLKYDDDDGMVRTYNEPDGTDDFFGQVQTPQGERSILKASEYIEGGILQFQLWVLEVRISDSPQSKDLTPENIVNALEFGQECGIGSNRTYESGKYDFIEFEEFKDKQAPKSVASQAWSKYRAEVKAKAKASAKAKVTGE